LEYIPIDMVGGSPRRFTATELDFSKIVGPEGVRYILWIDSVGVDVTEHVAEGGGVLRIGDDAIVVEELFDSRPWLFAKTIDAGSLHRYIEFLEPRCGALRGKRVVVAFSGGKDSAIAAYVASLLAQRLDYGVEAVYVHMPFLEPSENTLEAERIARRIGLELTVLEPPRKEVARELMRSGLPRAGSRICTYLKIAPLRWRRKALGIDYEAVGDRVWEGGRRFDRLFLRVYLYGIFVSSRTGFTPIAPLTLIDVVELCRALGTVHSLYLRGVQRVACRLCPHKSIYELYAVKQSLEDPGLIESAMRRDWSARFRDLGIDYEDFVRFHLWRFKPRFAKAMHRAKMWAERLLDRGAEALDAHTYVEKLREMWVSGVKAPEIGFERVFNVMKSSSKLFAELIKRLRIGSGDG